MLRTLDLCSGIGGFAYGLRGAAKTVAFCEIDPMCRSVLRDRMADGRLRDGRGCPIFEDVRTLLDEAGDLLRDALRPELLTAGFPCQDISVANPSRTKGGLDGPRSRLFFDIVGIFTALPSLRHVFLENSPALALRGGLERVVEELKKAGFAHVAHGRFTADSVGAPHVRRRLYVLASRDVQGLACAASRLRSRNKTFVPMSADELPPVLPRTSETTVESRRRHCMLGNAVVPQCAAMAFGFLAHELAAGREGDVSKRTPKTRVETDAIFRAELLCPDTPDRVLWEVTRLGTPTVQWQHAARMQRCTSGLYGPQIYAMRQSWDIARTLVPSLRSPWQARKHVVSNPEFTERVMGFPRGWTS